MFLIRLIAEGEGGPPPQPPPWGRGRGAHWMRSRAEGGKGRVPPPAAFGASGRARFPCGRRTDEDFQPPTCATDLRDLRRRLPRHGRDGPRRGLLLEGQDTRVRFLHGCAFWHDRAGGQRLAPLWRWPSMEQTLTLTTALALVCPQRRLRRWGVTRRKTTRSRPPRDDQQTNKTLAQKTPSTRQENY